MQEKASEFAFILNKGSGKKVRRVGGGMGGGIPVHGVKGNPYFLLFDH